MEFSRIDGKLRQLLGSHPRLWLPFARDWIKSRKFDWRPCSFPNAERLVLAPRQDYYESYQYFCEAFSGRREIAFFIRKLNSSDVMLDIGGFRGAYAMAAKARYPGLSIWVFEPVRANADRIREVLKLNHIGDIELREVAIGDNGPIRGSISAIDGMLRNVNGSGSEQVEVPTCSIDRFTAETGIAPTIIKLDVDGFELEAIKGAEECLKRHRPRLWIELHPTFLAANGVQVTDVTNLLTSFGYTVNPFSDINGRDWGIAYHVWAVPTSSENNMGVA